MNKQIKFSFLNEISYESNNIIDVSAPITSGEKFKVISLFSGCGGMDLGFRGDFKFLDREYEKNPFELIYANDIEKRAVETYNHNFSHDSECLDIKDKDLDEMPSADIVIGGFPCQDFSMAGKRKGLKSERGQLFLEMKAVIEKIKPIAFVAENVDGIRRSKKGDETSALEHIVAEFESIGYKVVYKPLNAKNFGVPQNRVRIIIVGIREDLNKKMYYPAEKYDDDNFVSSRIAIDDLWNKIDSKGVYNHSINDISRAKFYEGKKTQGNIQISADRPAPTIRAEHHGNIEGHYRSLDEKNPQDMSSWRRLSVRECARLQSFPDEFEFPCAATHAYRQIGNAVPPVMAWHIARALYLSLIAK